jgi:5-methylcytosine-specific restriction protein A
MTRRRVSPAERVAIFNRAHGRCHICAEKIGLAERWDVEHVIPHAMGGTEAKMDENLQPAHALCHKPKTTEDVGAIAKAKRREARHIGAHASRQPLPGGRKSPWKRTISGQWVRRDGMA